MTTLQMKVTPEDLTILWETNPLAQAQLQVIVKERLLVDAQKRISDLEAQLDKKPGKNSKAPDPVEVS